MSAGGANQPQSQSPQQQPSPVEAPPQAPAQQSQVQGAAAYREVPVSEMRRTIARRLATSLGPVPHFFLTTEIDMDKATEMRRSINDLDPELKVSINDFIIKVTPPPSRNTRKSTLHTMIKRFVITMALTSAWRLRSKAD